MTAEELNPSFFSYAENFFFSFIFTFYAENLNGQNLWKKDGDDQNGYSE